MLVKRLAALSLASTLAMIAQGAEVSEEEELAMSFGDKSHVSIATGSRVPVARAPSVATVITAEDIRAMGARDLDEVLETVPGLHVSRSPLFNSPVYTIRGVRGTLTNPQVLMLINGVPLTMSFTGDRGIVWGGMPLENVARIEVIRGPGSAIYGAEAFAGVINIITRSAADIRGTETGVRGGSFGTAAAWALHSTRWSDIDVAAYLEVSRTDGGGRTIDADAQTSLDAIFGQFGVPPVSHAPGPMNNDYKLIDTALELATGAWKFRGSYKRVYEVGSGAGVAQALDPTGNSGSQRLEADLSWHATNAGGDWDWFARANAARHTEDSQLVLFPPGSNLGAGFFQDGMFGAPAKWEHRYRLEGSATYSGLQGHRVRFGAGYAIQDLYKIREQKNFNPDFSPIGTGSIGDIVDVTDTVPFIEPHRREVTHAYLQDEWSIARDWSLTAGLRHDHYSDFGGTTHPRVALVWEAAYDVTAKLLYGSAFRAPAFTELYAINNPANAGNPELKPERVRTLELAASWQAASNARIGANVFRYWMTDIIVLQGRGAGEAPLYENQGRQTGKGVEIEAQWEPDRQWRLAADYALQHSESQPTGDDPGLAPRQHAQLRVDWRVTAAWQANAQVNWVADRRRQAGDTRPPIADYTTFDMALRANVGRSGWEFALIGRNLFDADAREPSPVGVPFVSIPHDLPLPGRAIFVTLGCRL